jgi:hypothetical protein
MVFGPLRLTAQNRPVLIFARDPTKAKLWDPP